MNGLLIHATLWTKLSEKSQTQKATCYMVPFIKNVQHRQIHMSGECVISLVLSRCSKTLKQQTSVTVWLQLSFIWQAKENTSSSCEGGPAQKKSGAQFWLLCLYAFFLLPLSLSYVNWTSQEGCLFHLRFSLHSLDLPLFHFPGLLPSLSFSHHHFGLLFSILTT